MLGLFRPKNVLIIVLLLLGSWSASSVKAEQAQAYWQCVLPSSAYPGGIYCPVSTANPLPIAPGASAVGITPTDSTITSATGSSQTLMALNASRHSMTVVNTGNANCGVNPTGGTAVLGGSGTLTLYPGGAYTPRIPTLSAVTAICTAGQPLYADQN